MKKTVSLMIIILFLLMLIPICKGDFIVQPREISITMDNEFILSNTSKKVMITNNNDYSINISWYLEHPNPISWMRPNKTFIPSLSWIDLNPKWYIIPPDDSVSFYIYLYVPESKDHLKQNWEAWVTFKKEYQDGIFNQEHAVRIYIDTPIIMTNNNSYSQNELSIPRKEPINILFLVIVISVVFVIIPLALGGLSFKKKKS